MTSPTLCLLLTLVVATQAATHVNISIAQQPATNPADVSYVDGSAGELRAGPQQHFERLQERPAQQQQMQQQQQTQQQQMPMQQQQQQQQSAQVAPQQNLSPRQGLGLQPVSMNTGRMPQRRRQHNRRPSLQQLPPHSGQFRQRSQQHRQNQEFERYIQSYHSHGPSVETVYESSNPTPQRYTQSGSSSSSSVSSSNLAAASPADDVVSIGAGSGASKSAQLRMFERQVAAPVAQSANVEQAQDSKPIYEAPAPSPSSAATSSVSVSSGSSSSAGGAPAVAESSFNIDQSYNRPSYEPNSYNYEDAQESDYQDQYPPAVDENAGSYDDYSDQNNGYLPPARGYGAHAPPRPLVTKTIQIAQPALKAKKYEVRHPAIQKEFYDIEERVVIKPAGTLVVELDHPVAKIPKGETLLPLGHPHPAVAAAYSNNGQVETQNYNNNEYRPQVSPAKEQSQVTTIGSSVTTMPSYETAPKQEFVEQQLQSQDVPDAPQEDTLSASDSQGNQYQINKKHLSPKMLTRQEPDYGRSEASFPAVSAQRGYQRNSYNRQAYQPASNDDYFSGEYLPNANAANMESKPARLEQQPPRPQIIKHEHNLHLPPSQHNIYLGRSRQPPPKELELPAHVAEVKPYLRQHVGPTVVYGKATARAMPAATRSYNYAQSSHQRSPLAEELEYSAPYSRMRMEPMEHHQQQHHHSARLQESPKMMVEQEQKSAAKAQIHLQIPHEHDKDQSIVATATISPAPAKPDCDQLQQTQTQMNVSPARLRQHQHQHFQRLVEAPTSVAPTTQATPTPTQQALDVDVSLNGAAGHLNRHLQPNERVISATAAPTDAAATRETFHTRRIVVNHPFQTVREVVEHEPITNYHHIQVNEPASPQLYHQAAYYQQPLQTHGNLVVVHQTTPPYGPVFG
ncbi:CG14961 [Drosophila busckii]|uniref:CG14961 n=1 Tax=Drosophila busckii TaxID=30019 RepID=A0A0M3QW11_DROBS|nr:mediator of RNA polymerase II transcription subunit 15 [Drosophila busckii]XP_017841894.1 mediator of RNA polymerase II transcription subunit 15 [Drosophila busckii]ALC43339.1 CG14961 [Drosophila busckii]